MPGPWRIEDVEDDYEGDPVAPGKEYDKGREED